MICFLDSRRAIWSTALVMGSLFILSGCKHVYRGHGVEPSISGPYIQPDDDEPLLDSPALYEPLPELSPVPPLPGAGHSIPPEPLPPPAPAEPTSTQAEPGQQPVSQQARSFWSQMSARASTGRSASVSPLPKLRQGRHAAVASNTVPNRITASHLAASPFGVSTLRTNSIASKIDTTTAGDITSFSNLAGERNNQPIESVSSPALRGGPSFPRPQSASAGVDTRGPVITPASQPMTTENKGIENWPHRPQTSTLVTDSQKNALPLLAREVQAAPSGETPFGSTEQAPDEVQEEVTVPSLLPPGP